MNDQYPSTKAEPIQRTWVVRLGEANGRRTGRVVTDVTPAGPFWEAGPEHRTISSATRTDTPAISARPGWVLTRRADVVAG